MMKNNIFKHVITKPKLKILLTFTFLLSVFSITHAQEAIVASGSNASGSGGSANYSVGQTIQNTNANVNGSVIQGIQFYFESSTLTITDLDTNLNISTFPNPTSSVLNIKTKDYQNGKLSYKLFNLLGELIFSGNITNNKTEININRLDTANYLLKISNNNNTIKTFKIIKN